MAAVTWLPGARKTPHGAALTYTDTGEPKGCLHTTETGRPSGYRGWKVPPHLEVEAIPGKGVNVQQFIPLDRAAFALRNAPGGAQTNRDGVVQIELIGSCDPKLIRTHRYYDWSKADDAVLLDLARKVIVPISNARGIPLRALRFSAYPGSAGRWSGRLSGPAWDAYSGWLGHQHAPENVHGDPGAFPWDRMITVYTRWLRSQSTPRVPAPRPPLRPSRGTPRPTPAPAPRYVLRRVLLVQRHPLKGADVKAVQRLVGAVVDGVYGQQTAAAVARWQHAHHLAADGVFGPISARAAGWGFAR